jgi:hypothetical protein
VQGGGVSELSWSEFGIVGAVVGSIVVPFAMTFIWWIRASREDLNRTRDEFIRYLKDTSVHQTEILAQVGRVLERTTATMEREAEKADARHAEVLLALESLRSHLMREVR